MSELTRIIQSQDPEIRNRSLEGFCRSAGARELLDECNALDRFRRVSDNLYERVRAQFFLYAIHRFHLPYKKGVRNGGLIPYAASAGLLKRRFDEAIEILLAAQSAEGCGAALSSGLAAAYYGLGFQTLADQVRRSVRSVRGNQWMSRIGHPSDYPLTIRREMRLQQRPGLYPILRETTPVRMDLSHSGWSDIFFLGMDYPEGARVLNVSIDLALRGTGGPQPPVEAYFRVIDEPVARLTSVDLGATADVASFAEMFDFARDYLGLLKAAVIASGIVPQAMEGSPEPLADLLSRLAGPGRGIDREQGARHSQGVAAGGFDEPAGLPDLGVHAGDGPDPRADGNARRERPQADRGAGDSGGVDRRIGRRLAGFRRRLAGHETDRGRAGGHG